MDILQVRVVQASNHAGSTDHTALVLSVGDHFGGQGSCATDFSKQHLHAADVVAVTEVCTMTSLVFFWQHGFTKSVLCSLYIRNSDVNFKWSQTTSNSSVTTMSASQTEEACEQFVLFETNAHESLSACVYIWQRRHNFDGPA